MSTAFADEVIFMNEKAGLSGPAIARAVGAQHSTVRSWLNGSRSPSSKSGERVAELSSIVERLMSVMDPDYIQVWLIKPVPALDFRKPIDVIREGGYLEVSRIVSAMESPPAS